MEEQTEILKIKAVKNGKTQVLFAPLKGSDGEDNMEKCFGEKRFKVFLDNKLTQPTGFNPAAGYEYVTPEKTTVGTGHLVQTSSKANEELMQRAFGSTTGKMIADAVNRGERIVIENKHVPEAILGQSVTGGEVSEKQAFIDGARPAGVVVYDEEQQAEYDTQQELSKAIRMTGGNADQLKQMGFDIIPNGGANKGPGQVPPEVAAAQAGYADAKVLGGDENQVIIEKTDSAPQLTAQQMMEKLKAEGYSVQPGPPEATQEAETVPTPAAVPAPPVEIPKDEDEQKEENTSTEPKDTDSKEAEPDSAEDKDSSAKTSG